MGGSNLFKLGSLLRVRGLSVLRAFVVPSPMASSGSAARGDFNWKKYERPGLMQDEIEEMKDAFDLFDVDRTQRVNPRDLARTVQALGLRRSQVVQHILSDLERQGARPLDFAGFLDLMTAKMGERDTKDDVSKVFRLFDDDRSN